MKKFILIALSCAFGLTAWSQSKSKFDIARESFQNEFINAFNGDDTSKLYARLITDAEVIAVSKTNDPGNNARVVRLMNEDSTRVHLELYAWQCSGVSHASRYSTRGMDDMFTTFNKLDVGTLVRIKDRSDSTAGLSKVDLAINKSLGSYIIYRKYLERHNMIRDTASRMLYLGKRMCDSKLMATIEGIRIFKGERKAYRGFIRKLKSRAEGMPISFVSIDDAAYCNKSNAGCYPRINFKAGDKSILCMWPIIFIDNKWKFFKSPDIR